MIGPGPPVVAVVIPQEMVYLVQYSLLKRDIETNGVLDAARELGITIVAWSPLARGIFTGKYHTHPGRLEKNDLHRE